MNIFFKIEGDDLTCKENLFFEKDNVSKQLEREYPSIELINKIEYDYDVIPNLFQQEEKEYYLRNPNYMINFQKNINPFMRAILSDWLMEVSSQFGFKRTTYHLTMTLLDKFLMEEKNILTSKFQLIGVTMLIISAKQEVKLKSK